ncbi:hypothetical protein IJ541_09650 [bacterium]|nr:hypothetical protein [bacterium]
MQEILSILKLLAFSNTFNFILMLVIFALIIKKINLNKIFQSSIEKVENFIKKSDETKANSKKVLDDARILYDKLPDDISELKANSKNKIEVFRQKVDENTDKTIKSINENAKRVISIEEKKISNLLCEKTSTDALDLAKNEIIDMLKSNPELHNKFIQNSIDELDKVKL